MVKFFVDWLHLFHIFPVVCRVAVSASGESLIMAPEWM